MASGRMQVTCMELSLTAVMKSCEPRDVAEAGQTSTTGTKASSQSHYLIIYNRGEVMSQLWVPRP